MFHEMLLENLFCKVTEFSSLKKNFLLVFQIKAFDLEQSLQEVTERYEKEKQKRRALHNSLVVSIFNSKTFSYFVVIMSIISSPVKVMDTLFMDISPPPAVYIRCTYLLRHVCLTVPPTPIFLHKNLPNAFVQHIALRSIFWFEY